jgi:hypothetical protein
MVTGRRALIAGALAWLAIMVVFWPVTASFGDCVGYLGEARLLLAGHLRPQGQADIGIWQLGVSKYPLFPSALLAPLLAIAPRAVFAIGAAAALVTCWLAARVLESWDVDPVAALLVLAHPTIILVSRTAMADVPECALMLGAWWSFRNDRRIATVACCAGLFAIKATGGMLGAAILGGEMLRRMPSLRRREEQARRALATALLATAAGFATVIACNELSTGRYWFGYDFGGIPPFSPAHLATTAPKQLINVLVIPPLLIAGALPFWRRREWGPLAVIFGFGGAMCFYFFVDYGTNWIETLVLAPRLLLPVIVFLLIGYGALLAQLARHLGARPALLRAALGAATMGGALVIGFRHARYQRPGAEALAGAERIARDAGVRELGVLPEADKVGVMFSGNVHFVDRRHPAGMLLLCNARSASYRAPLPEGTLSCVLPGYRLVERAGDFAVLQRIEGQPGPSDDRSRPAADPRPSPT